MAGNILRELLRLARRHTVALSVFDEIILYVEGKKKKRLETIYDVSKILRCKESDCSAKKVEYLE